MPRMKVQSGRNDRKTGVWNDEWGLCGILKV